MKVSKKLINGWKIKFKHGDMENIAVAYGKHRNTIANAFKRGEATQETIDIIELYYSTK